jgi:hypothetical protein
MTTSPARRRVATALVPVVLTVLTVLDAPPAHAASFDSGTTADVLGLSASGNRLLLYRGNGSGGFVSGHTTLTPDFTNFNVVFSPGDFDGDGDADLLARNSVDSDLYLIRGDGSGGAGSISNISNNWSNFDTIFSPGDFDGDGKADVIARSGTDHDLYLYRGNGTGGFLSGPHKVGENWQNFDIVFSPGDFDGDTFPDVLARNIGDHDLYLYRGNGSTWISSGKNINNNWSAFDQIFSPGDFDGDGKADVIARNAGDDDLYLYRGNGTGGFYSGNTKIGNNWGGFEQIFSPAPKRRFPATPARADGLHLPVYFVHGYKLAVNPLNMNDYWGGGRELVNAFTTNLTPPGTVPANDLIVWCYYSDDIGCTRNVGGSLQDSIVEIGKKLAWDIFNNYNRQGRPVDIVAHSMGGLIVRSMLTGIYRNDFGYPPFLYVEDVVTVATPHAGLYGEAVTLCIVISTPQCDEMRPSSAFMAGLMDSPTSALLTDWTWIGSDDDVVAPASTSVPDGMFTTHKVIYNAGQLAPQAHMGILGANTGSYALDYCDLGTTYCLDHTTFTHNSFGFNPAQMIRYAVWNSSYW